MESQPVPSAQGPAALGALQAAATLLPAFALALPGGPLSGDVAPEATAAGLGLLLTLPASLLMVARRARPAPAGALWFALFLAAGYASLLYEHPADTFGASRALLTSIAGAIAFLSAASLDAAGRAWLARGAVVLCAWLVVPVFGGAEAAAGALGNSGSTSETALAGAAAGLVLCTRGAGAWRWLSGAAAVALAVYAGLAPVLAGIVALGVAITANSWFALRARRGHWFATALGLACVFAFGVAYVRTHAQVAPAATLESSAQASESASADPETPDPGTPDPVAADLLGGEVRWRLWRSVAHMTRDYGLFGTGPGQLGAAFPPYRDPAEIAISSAPELGRETEVEHAHNDWVQGIAETGLGGIAWVVFLLIAAARAARAAGDRELARAALGTAALAVLVNALLRSPLTFNPGSTALFAVLGAVCSRPERDGRRAGALYVGLTLVLALASAPRAWSLFAHGRALTTVFTEGDEGGLERALEACPDSVTARSIQAQFAKLTGTPEDPARAVEDWNRVLEVRPHRLVAWMELGRLHAQAGDTGAARWAWERALRLAPANPVLLRNLARLEAGAGDTDAALARLEALGDTSRETLLAIASDAVLVGSNAEAALALASRADPQRPALTAQSAWNLAQTLEDTDPFRARWLEGAAHLTWAREHRAAGRLDDATRSYRQALRNLYYRVPRSEDPVFADALVLELAATLADRGLADEARSELRRLRSPDALRPAPDWVRDALSDLLPASE